MEFFKNRFKEPSTWAGFSMLIPTLMAMFSGGLTPVTVVQAMGAVAAVLVPEASK